MANTVTPQHSRHGHEDDTPKNDLMAIVLRIQERPAPYIGGVLFVILVLVVTGLFRASQATKYTEAADQFARALDLEEPKERATALASLADQDTALTARALYLQAESLLEAGDNEGARAAFVKLRDKFPNYEFIPESVEGLALIAEDAGKFADARGLYEEVAEKWPDSPAAKRQAFNIARCLEGEGQLAQAVEKYRDQIEEFPGSMIAVRAQTRLDELRASNPELFPVEAAAQSPEIQILQTAPDAAAVESPVEGDASAEGQPAAPAAEPAPDPAAPTESAPAEAVPGEPAPTTP